MAASPEQVQLFTKLERDRVAASLNKNIGCLTSMLHDDFVFVHSNGRVDTRSDYLELLEHGDLTYVAMRSRDVDVRSVGVDVASVLSRIDFVADYLGRRLEVSALVLTVWVRTVGKWRAFSIQSTLVPGEAITSQ